MNLHTLSNSAIPLHRADIESMLEAVVAMQRVTGEMALVLTASLDRVDGDADQENATDLEDDFALSPLAQGFDKGRGPGCEVSDTGEYASIEWTTMRGSQKRGPNIAPPEDDEEDDPSGQYDEDDYTAPRLPGYGPGCNISDPDFEHDGREEQERLTPIYGVNQTGLPLNLNSWKGEQVPDFPCGPIRPAGR